MNDSNISSGPIPSVSFDAAENITDADIHPPEIDSMNWYRLYRTFSLMVRDCQDKAEKEQLTELHHIMQNGKTDERRAACSTLLAYRKRTTAVTPPEHRAIEQHK